MKPMSVLMLLAAMAVGGCADLPGVGARGAVGSETVQVAQAAYNIGDYPEAARLYERAVAADPRSVPALVGLGRTYASMGQFERAKNALENAERIAPQRAEVQVELGHLALTRMHPRDALTYYDAALQADRRNLQAFTGKAVALDYLSRHAEAQQVYRAALAVYPTDFSLLSNYALSKVLSGEIGEGIRLMEELLRDPRQGQTVRANMALAYALDGRESDARAMMVDDMSAREISETLAYYRKVRVDYLAGKPIGYLVFR